MAALAVGLIGSTAVALAECGMTTWMAAKHVAIESLPPGLLLASLGKVAVTHTLVWCPLMVVGTLLLGACARRVRENPEPFTIALFVALTALVVVPADLAMAYERKRAILIGGCAASLVLALGVIMAVQPLARRLGPRRVCRFIYAASLACVIVIAGSGIVFVRSPLFDAAAYCVPPGQAARASQGRPNVLWIVLDTARPDRMSCYGYDRPTTPFLEDWAAGALVFDRAYSNGMWTVPSHASMFTGLSTRAHGADANNLWLDDSIRTVAQILRENGYATASFSNNPHVSPDTNLTKGFETARVVYYLRRVGSFSLEYLCERAGITPPLPWLDGDFGAALTNQLVGRWLDLHAADDAPIFLFINYMETHLPYRVPGSYRAAYLTEEQVQRSYDLRRRAFGSLVTALDQRYNIEGPDFVSGADREILKGAYDAALRYLDDRVREVIGVFEQRGLLENTLVVIVTDHGEHLDTHGMWGHRFNCYNDLVHVALLLREPKRESGLRSAAPVQLSDLFPTVLRATLGESFDAPGSQATDLLALTAEGGEPRIAIVEYNGPTPPVDQVVARVRKIGTPELLHRISPQIAVVDGRWKYIVADDGRRELYDLRTDFAERHNLIKENPADAARLDDYIRKWREAVPEFRPADSAAGHRLPQDTLDALRSLGYVGDDTDRDDDDK